MRHLPDKLSFIGLSHLSTAIFNSVIDFRNYIAVQYVDGTKNTKPRFSVAAVFNVAPIFIYLNRRFRSPAVAGSLHAPAKILAAPLSRGLGIRLSNASHLLANLKVINQKN